MKSPSPAAPAVYRPQQQAQTAQPKTANTAHSPKPPVAPRVYRPQPVHGHLQAKTTQAAQPSVQPAWAHRHAAAPPPSRPQFAHTTLQAKTVADQRRATPAHALGHGATVPRQIIQRAPAQAFRSGVVQAVKFYPNLHPGAAVPVDRSNIFTLDNFADQYRLHRIHSHSVNVPNMKYNFVRTREGQTLLHNRYRHPSLAEGQQVLYAGEVFFNNGRLQWWSNGSGHYQPDADGAEQANLPMDYFYSYQQIMKGEHTRRRGSQDSITGQGR
jgi:hypothetical protein